MRSVLGRSKRIEYRHVALSRAVRFIPQDAFKFSVIDVDLPPRDTGFERGACASMPRLNNHVPNTRKNGIVTQAKGTKNQQDSVSASSYKERK